MTPTKGDVKHWLKAIGKNRDWLAIECGTEKGTVNNWLSPPAPSRQRHVENSNP